MWNFQRMTFYVENLHHYNFFRRVQSPVQRVLILCLVLFAFINIKELAMQFSHFNHRTLGLTY